MIFYRYKSVIMEEELVFGYPSNIGYILRIIEMSLATKQKTKLTFGLSYAFGVG